MGRTEGSTEFDTPRRAKVRGVFSFLQDHGLLGKKPGQVTVDTVCDYFGISRQSAHNVRQNRVPFGDLPPEIEEDPAYQRCSSPDCRRLVNDPRASILGQRSAPQVFTQEDGLQVHGYLSSLREEDLWEEVRQLWIDTIWNAGVQKTVSNSTISRRMTQWGWRSCREELRDGNTSTTEQARQQRAAWECDDGRWFDLTWRQKVIACDEWHFSFQIGEEREFIHRRPADRLRPFTVKDIPPAKQRKIDEFEEIEEGMNVKEIDFPVTMAPYVKRRRTRRNGTEFVKKAVHERTSIHAFVIVGLFIRKMYWYESHTNDTGKMDGDTYAELLKLAFDDIHEKYGKHFILWEDGDSSHTSPEALATKKQYGFLQQCIQNAPKCPETNPIEDRAIANVVKGTTKRSPHLDIVALKELAEEGLYNNVKDDNLVNVWEDMPNRWEQIRNNGGRRINR